MSGYAAALGRPFDQLDQKMRIAHTKKRYTILFILWPIFIVSLVLALPSSNDNAVMILGLEKSGQDNRTALSGPLAQSDSSRISDSAIVVMLLFGTGVLGLVGINRKKGA